MGTASTAPRRLLTAIVLLTGLLALSGGCDREPRDRGKHEEHRGEGGSSGLDDSGCAEVFSLLQPIPTEGLATLRFPMKCADAAPPHPRREPGPPVPMFLSADNFMPLRPASIGRTEPRTIEASLLDSSLLWSLEPWRVERWWDPAVGLSTRRIIWRDLPEEQFGDIWAVSLKFQPPPEHHQYRRLHVFLWSHRDLGPPPWADDVSTTTPRSPDPKNGLLPGQTPQYVLPLSTWSLKRADDGEHPILVVGHSEVGLSYQAEPKWWERPMTPQALEELGEEAERLHSSRKRASRILGWDFDQRDWMALSRGLTFGELAASFDGIAPALKLPDEETISLFSGGPEGFFFDLLTQQNPSLRAPHLSYHGRVFAQSLILTRGGAAAHEDECRGEHMVCLHIGAGDFQLTAGGEPVAPAEGCDPQGPTVCRGAASAARFAALKRAAALDTRGRYGEANEHYEQGLGAYDWRRLYERAVTAKGALDGVVHRLHVSADPSVPIEVVVRAMDVVRFERQPHPGMPSCTVTFPDREAFLASVPCAPDHPRELTYLLGDVAWWLPSQQSVPTNKEARPAAD